MVVQIGQNPALHGWPRAGLNREDKLGLRHVDADRPGALLRLDAQAKHLRRRCDARHAARTATVNPATRGFTFAVQSGPLAGSQPSLAGRFTCSRQPAASLKRRRHGLDVDGPNTAALSSKKRRLRGDLITSRLSQPYSQPATHILNREGIKSGDKRFLKMATSIELARRVVHLHATSFLRFSVMNRLRRRLGLGAPGMAYRAEAASRVRPELDTTARAPWTSSTPSPYEVPALSTSPSPASTPAPSSPPSPDRGSASAKSPAIRVSKPAALPMPSADLSAAKDRTSTRIDATPHPPERSAPQYDELDEDGFSFMHADDAGDVPDEQVYTDFGAIFGGGDGSKQSDDNKRAGDDSSYEEYLDELDGISWMTR